MHKQLTITFWFFVKDITVVIRTNMHLLNYKLAIIYAHPRVFKIYTTSSD